MSVNWFFITIRFFKYLKSEDTANVKHNQEKNYFKFIWLCFWGNCRRNRLKFSIFDESCSTSCIRTSGIRTLAVPSRVLVFEILFTWSYDRFEINWTDPKTQFSRVSQLFSDNICWSWALKLQSNGLKVLIPVNEALV